MTTHHYSRIILLCAALFMSGCGPSSREDGTVWIPRNQPVTAEQKERVLGHVERIVASISMGHDSGQDWRKIIETAHEEGRQTICQTTYWEFSKYGFTGRWSYVTNDIPLEK